MAAGEPSYTTSHTTNTTQRAFTSSLGLFFVVFSLVIILAYCFYKYKRSKRSQPPLPPPTAVDSDDDDYHFMRLSTGLGDDVLETFPTFLYSEIVMLLSGETNYTATHSEINCASGCSVCLADYKPADVVRLLPDCGHVFHVICIDTWLKVRPTCPVCRNSPLPTPPELS